jgi:hypothetical protein
MHELTDPPIRFATRGIPSSDAEHRDQVLLPALGALQTRSVQLERLFSSGPWDPDESACIGNFNALVGALDAALDLVDDLRRTMPPLTWRAVHRELTRAAASQARGQISIALSIIAPTVEMAQQCEEFGNEAFTVGRRHAERASACLDRMRRLPRGGPFQPDGSLDFAALAWASVAQTPRTITGAAALVRQGFAEVPGVVELPDERVVTLLPSLALTASTVDADLLIRRAQALRNVLDASHGAGTWVSDPTLLVERVRRGIERLLTEIQRLGWDVRTNAPRQHVMRSLTRAYHELVEGTLRDLGGVFVIAARAIRGDGNGTYEQPVIDGIHAGEVLTELGRLGELFRDAVEMLYRNASAHADIEVVDNGVVATQRTIEGGRVSDTRTEHVSDAEFAEDFAALQELLLAMQMAVLPWLWVNADPGVAAAVAATVDTPAEVARVLSLLGGIAGLTNMSVTVGTGHMSIFGVPTGSDVCCDTTRLLSIVPAAFASPDTTHVTLQVGGLPPVTYARSEVVTSKDVPHHLAIVGLVAAKWLRATGARWTVVDEATFVTLPLASAHFECATLAARAPVTVDNIERAIKALRIVRRRLLDVMPSGYSPLTQRAIAEVDKLDAALRGILAVRQGRRSTADGERLAQQAAATLARMHKVQQDAIAVRDGLHDRPASAS